MLCAFLAGQVMAQNRTVTGKVTSSEDGSVLPGVNVLLKGTTRGAVTDVNGVYKVEISGADPVLVFSFVGFLTQEIPVGAQATIDLVLQSDAKQITEVVVTALGIEKDKKGLGISVKEVSNSELTVARTTNVVNALSGKIAGVRVAGNNGMVGSSSAIFITSPCLWWTACPLTTTAAATPPKPGCRTPTGASILTKTTSRP
ncbi:MAG: carboxypeptidase-like regulatory domain-containing protein [Bernardetiaceae bacterium]|nr:carboxypeptidase-like regulatory domain-containing protein [Bernardetiaceae bacterium]